MSCTFNRSKRLANRQQLSIKAKREKTYSTEAGTSEVGRKARQRVRGMQGDGLQPEQLLPVPKTV